MIAAVAAPRRLALVAIVFPSNLTGIFFCPQILLYRRKIAFLALPHKTLGYGL